MLYSSFVCQLQNTGKTFHAAYGSIMGDARSYELPRFSSNQKSKIIFTNLYGQQLHKPKLSEKRRGKYLYYCVTVLNLEWLTFCVSKAYPMLRLCMNSKGKSNILGNPVHVLSVYNYHNIV